MTVVGIAADFDPPHRGHAYLLERATELGEEVVVFLNADYTAHHTPPLLPYELRAEIVLELGADDVRPVRGYHQRFPLAYTVPVRVATMAEAGVDVILDAGPRRDLEEVRRHAERVLKRGDLFSIPKTVPARNLVRWLAAVELVNRRLGTDVELRIVPELPGHSGRRIRAALRRADYSPDALNGLRRHLPDETFRRLKRYLSRERPPIARRERLVRTANAAGPDRICSVAHVNTLAARELLRGRPFRDERQLWGALRRAGYGSVLTRLALANLECRVTSEELARTALEWVTQGLVPPGQSPHRMYERDWFVARLSAAGVPARTADRLFRRADSYREAADRARERYRLDPGKPRRSVRIGSASAPDGAYRPAVNARGIFGVLADGEFLRLELTAFGATLLRYVIDDPFVDARVRVEDGEAWLEAFPGGPDGP